ncbi:hypothetical protein B1806_02555 [Metallibacterium scheffleri]|uniref:Holin n=1 Tax=Metallibacterium scheffleri TaxID=993689 RepID=A0A4S3KRC3_9GAMM|nr:hypothetical protein B1806_02555 [Metallibacterium scheffleri]
MKYKFTMRAMADTIRRDAKWIAAAIFGWGVWHGTTMAAAAASAGYVASFVVAWAMDMLGGRK